MGVLRVRRLRKSGGDDRRLPHRARRSGLILTEEDGVHFITTKRLTWSLILVLCLVVPVVVAQSEDLGKGFKHHGVATPVSSSRGTVATVDGSGKPVALVWLFDHSGGYAILVLDAETGQAQQVATPFPPGKDCPYASILSSKNKYYTHFNSYFSEFDPAQRAFTFYEKTAPQMAMSMTEDDKGRIWSASYPQGGLVCFDPKSRKLTDYGHVYPQNWNEYPRSIAADDAGWIYFGDGSTQNQIVMFDPKTAKATPVIPDDKRSHGSGLVYRSTDGKVYGQANEGQKSDWYMFYKGKATVLQNHVVKDVKKYIAGPQGLFHRDFPDGRRIKELDTVEKLFIVENPKTGETKEFKFNYTSEGAHIMGLADAPDKTICGGTAFPMRFFSYDPAADKWVNRESYIQWNTVGMQGDRFFVGGYTGGFLLEWDPAKPWVKTERGNPNSNPLFLTQCAPTINRPHRLLPHPDGKLVIMTGGPDYGYTGGGMLVWDRVAKTPTVLTDKELIPDQSTVSLVALPKGKLLGGSTTSPGTGGEKKAKEAEIYVMDLATKKIEWHAVAIPGVQEYTDMTVGPKGLVYGFADRKLFFVFDPVKRQVVHQQPTEPTFGLTCYQQGPRVFVRGPKGQVYVLFEKGIAVVESGKFAIRMLAESPVPINYGGDYLNGRIYFGSGSHVYSYGVTE
jgi:hypothetical protein